MSQNNPLPRRKPFQIYVPVHRRNNTQSESASPTKSIDSTTTTTTNTSTGSQDDGLVRRGRGRFRAPSSSPTSGHSPIQSPCPSSNDKQQQQQQQQSIVNDSKSSSTSSSSHSSLSVSGNPASPLTTTPTTKNTITDENLAASMEKSLSLESKEDWEQLDDELELENNNKNTGKSKAKKSIPASSSSPPPPIEAGTTILDCSGFPASFKTYHIQDMFRIYEDMPGSFKIKWMDDTRALIIFGSAATAKRAYIDNINNPTAKIRPYTGPVEFTASPKGEPIPQRPATTDMVARRLVHGALGMKRPTRTREQLQQEKDMLQSVREQREAKKQQAAREANEISNAFFG
ncbi:hypothetical protein LRAMOSA09760 [Lichtheimia ramosa]|uniref:Thc1 RRM domain-containing protein n=1 Tax=Lichtheimia ramosa TaxID=688394 RepID=A0A077WNS8_9FUNG|nr:hypothetical protein LRAMOSA09760 [Lichtheimia ramosa]